MKLFTKSLLVLSLFLLTAVSAFAQINLYWVGGSGNWSDHSNHWALSSGGAVYHNQVPSPLDTVIFDANSFPSGGTVSLNVDAFCSKMVWGSGMSTTPTFSGSGKVVEVGGDFTLDVPVNWSLSGGSFNVGGDFTYAGANNINMGNMNVEGDFNMTPSASVNFSYGSLYLAGSLTTQNTNWLGSWIYFDGTTTGHTITSNGDHFDNVMFQGQGGEWTLTDDFEVDGETQFKWGSFVSDGNNVDFGWRLYALFGDADFDMDFTGTDTVRVERRWRIQDNMSNININMGTSVLHFYYTNHDHFYFNGGSKTYHDVFFEHTHPTSSHTIYVYNNNTFNDVTFYVGGQQRVRMEGSQTCNDVLYDVYYDGAKQNWTPYMEMWNSNFNSLTCKHESGAFLPRMYFYSSANLGDFYVGQGWDILYTWGQQTVSSMNIDGGCKSMVQMSSQNGSGIDYNATSGAVISINGALLTNINTTGGATFNATNSFGVSGNTGVTFGSFTSTDFYWIGGTGNWSDTANWASTSGG
jgi:hypothetical protein